MSRFNITPFIPSVIVCSALASGVGVLNLGAQSPTSTVTVRLSEWKVELSTQRVPAGQVTFTATNGGTIPHALEIEGRGIEREIPLIQPNAAGSLTLALKPGAYEVYCPVGEDSHKRLGMKALLVVGSGPVRPNSPEKPRTPPKALAVTGGGPVIQILPGPFPFSDSAAQVLAMRPEADRQDLMQKESAGPYSNSVAKITGTFSLTAWDFGATRDSVVGTAEFQTTEGRWRLALDSVQTKDIPFNPRFGGVIMGLYYHGATGVHTPLVPTIRSAVALWAWGHLYQNDSLVTDRAMVHVMLLSRTRRPSDFALACWDCSKNRIEELQLQVTTPSGSPKLASPGGFLFVNWQRSTARPK